jgi:spore coat polysaccharide biosynthesis protein SpsF (cytidylyltransferase family)
MYKNEKILGLIPARGGSKRLPGKNIKPLLGKPLIAWTIEPRMKRLQAYQEGTALKFLS